MGRIAVPLMIFVLIGIDQLSKYLVETNLILHQRVPVMPFLSFFRTYNEGIAFSMLNFVGNDLLIILIIAVTLFVFWMWTKTDLTRFYTHVGFAFILAGAIGNLIDRVALGHVVDFIMVHSDGWSFAIFNLADSFVTIGAICIIFDEIIQYRKSDQETIK